MNRARRRSAPGLATALLSAAIGVVVCVFARPPQAGASPATKVAQACMASIRVPASDAVYENLVVPRDGKVSLTCPVNIRSLQVATVFILNGADFCRHTRLFGYPVLRHSVMANTDARKRYDACSGVVHLKGRKIVHSGAVTYLWRSKLPDASARMAQMSGLFGRVTGAIMASGLPVTDLENLDGVYCFEVDSGYDRDLMARIRGLGVPIPSSVHEAKYLHKPCNTLLRVEFLGAVP